MNKVEFYQFVDSFEGIYDEVTLLTIGKKFRELPVKQRNWKELVDYLGINKSPDAFRTWVYRNEDLAEDLLAERDAIAEDASMKFVKNQKEDIAQTDDEKAFREDYKIITKNRDILNAYRKTIRDEARIEVLRDAVKETVSQLNALPDMTDDMLENYDGNVEAVALLSDLHIGVECENFYNKYNVAIATKRLNRWALAVEKYCIRNGVSRLNILNLGDLIHGLIHVSARLEQQYDVVEQIMIASELVANALNILTKLPCEIIYRSVTDNHSRAVANLHEHIEKENFYRLIDWYLQERLKDTKIQFINDNLDDSLGVFTLLNGKKFAFAHGHLENYNASFQNLVGATREFIDYIAMGHFHSEKMKTFQGAKVYVNGSIVGTEQYALSKRLFSKPCQTLLIFDDLDNELNISINLDI